MSKEMYDNGVTDYSGHGNVTYVDPVSGMETKSGVINEAGELYGNIETAEEYGYVQRG